MTDLECQKCGHKMTDNMKLDFFMSYDKRHTTIYCNSCLYKNTLTKRQIAQILLDARRILEESVKRIP